MPLRGNEGRVQTTTINEYQRVLTNVVLPELGGLRLLEVTTSRLDLFLVRLRATSASCQRKTKVGMGAMLGMAVRHDALAMNPIQQTSRIHRHKSETRSLAPGRWRRVPACEPGPRDVASTTMHSRFTGQPLGRPQQLCTTGRVPATREPRLRRNSHWATSQDSSQGCKALLHIPRAGRTGRL